MLLQTHTHGAVPLQQVAAQLHLSRNAADTFVDHGLQSINALHNLDGFKHRSSDLSHAAFCEVDGQPNSIFFGM